MEFGIRHRAGLDSVGELRAPKLGRRAAGRLAMSASNIPATVDAIAGSILTLRGQRVILDADLAALYGAPTKRLNEQVKRNVERFPADFMFRLSAEEIEALNRSQIATGSQKHRDPRFAPFAFTEHGAMMAGFMLNSPHAVEVSIYVVRAFVRLRETLATHREFAAKLDTLEQKTELLSLQHDTFAGNTRAQLKQVFEALRQLAAPPAEPPRRPIGFVTGEVKKTKDKG